MTRDMTAVYRRAQGLELDTAHYHRRTLCEMVARLEDELAGRVAEPVIELDEGGTTGRCRCSACGGAIGPWDRFCKHCGAKLEVKR